MGCHALLQGLFLIQGLNWHLNAGLPALASWFLPLAPPGKPFQLILCVSSMRLGKSNPRHSVANSKGTCGLL